MKDDKRILIMLVFVDKKILYIYIDFNKIKVYSILHTCNVFYKVIK